MKVSASSEPSGTAAACSNVSSAGFGAITPLSRTVTYSAFAPPSKPKTSSPSRNSVTAAPTSSTTPANFVPAIVRLGRRTPVMRRVNGYSALRKPVSVRVTVEAWTWTSTSSSFGAGRSTSVTRVTSGGPYRSWTTALMRSPHSRRLAEDQPRPAPGWCGRLRKSVSPARSSSSVAPGSCARLSSALSITSAA